MNVEIHIGSPDEALLRHASDLLESFPGDGPVTRSDTSSNTADHRTLDPVAVAGVVLSLPGAALALMQLVEQLKQGRRRRELKARLDPLLESARSTDEQATLIVGGRVVRLARASSDDVLDTLEAAAADVDDER